MIRLPHLLAIVCALALPAPAAQAAGVERPDFGGRQMIVYVPAHLPPSGARALVVVLHGGLGNADRIYSGGAEKGLNLDALAEKDGFIVAYLNGTPVTRMMGAPFKGWNAGGGCCGVPAAEAVDDVGYITGAVGDLAGRYGIDRRRVFAIHGADDANVPIQGGVGAKGLSKVAYRSEAASGRTWAASGAIYALDVVQGADHFLDHIDARMQQAEGVTIGRKAAAFFGLEAGGEK